MSDLTDVYAALQKADAAGDTAGAKQLADYIRSQQTPAAPDESSGRIAGLGYRAAVTGLGDVVSIPANLMYLAEHGAAATRAYVRQKLGLPPENDPTLMKPPTNYGEQAANIIGLPSPQTSGERLGSAAVRGATSGAAAGSGAVGPVRAMLAGASGATGSEVARQAGFGPIGQTVAGAVAGAAPSVIEGAGRAAVQVGRNALRPLTQEGQTDVAANSLRSMATNPGQAATNLETAPQIVPGSPRTMGETSQDTGLLAAEKAIRARNPGDFGQVISQQNTARQNALQGLAGTESDITSAQAARDAATAPMREAALGAGGKADVAPVVDKIDSILSGPVGKRDIPSQALTWLKAKLVDKAGNPETDPANLYAVRQDIGDALAGRLGGEQAKYRLASGQLIDVRKSLDDAIEQAAPGFQAYLRRYADLSKPINQQEAMQEIARRANTTATDVTSGQPFMSSAGFSRALDSALQDGGLSDSQVAQLRAIKTDLAQGQAINSPLVKAPGSDTFQNLSIAQVLGAGVDSKFPGLRVLAKPLGWLYKMAGSDQGANDILKNAALDPKFAAALLRRATPKSVFDFSQALQRIYGGGALGGAVSQMQNSSPPQASTGTQ